MNDLEKLIYEALLKFPSEDIRELVARETGLTVEEVSQKMNEAAKTAGISFPSTSFVLNETKSVIKPTESTDTNTSTDTDTSTEDKNTESSTETDDMDAILKGYLDSNKDGKITYKIGYLPEPASHYINWSSFGDLLLSDIQFKTKTTKVGTKLTDALKDENYDKIFAPHFGFTGSTPLLCPFNENDFKTISDLYALGIMEDYYADDTFVCDGSVVFLYKAPDETK